MIHVIYNSAATVEFSDSELLDLLEKARNNNAAQDITGMLLHIDGCFFQVLEGPDEAVDRLVERISEDPRHAKMTVIIRETIAKRSFKEWTMGFAKVSSRDLETIDGLNDFFVNQGVLTDLDAGRAKKLLEAFGRGRWRVRLAAREQTAFALEEALLDPKPKVAATGHTPRPDFSFAYQPIVNASERSIAGYEALTRGEHNEPTAQVLQRIPLGEVTAFQEDSRRMAIGMASRLGLEHDLHLGIIPRAEGERGNCLDSAVETARQCEIDPERLIIEIKHEMSLHDPLALADWLKEYRRIGLRISIGDFGSGHAGLALLDHYQPELISLSMWLVQGIEGHGPRQAIIRGLVQTCGDLGIDIVAKGVSTTEEYAWLVNEGVEFLQGDLLATPGFESLPKPMLPIG